MNELGELRPSQLIFTFGVGALVDLPTMSAMIMGLDDWDERYCSAIDEDRLVAAIQRRLGGQMQRLLRPPVQSDDARQDPAAPAVGVPVAPFPRWLRCTACNTIGTIESTIFKLMQDRYRADRTQYRHVGCSKHKQGLPPAAISVRFLIACANGHLSDFPWRNYVHQGSVPCEGGHMTLYELGASGDLADVWVKCSCGKSRNMADAFDSRHPFQCPGHHPHLRVVDTEPCEEGAKSILLGASNSWFPNVLSALAIPRAEDKLGKQIEAQWHDLQSVEDEDELRLMRKRSDKFKNLIGLFEQWSDAQIWQGIVKRRQGNLQEQATFPVLDLKLPEWEVFSHPDAAPEGEDFRLRRVAAPQGFEAWLEDTVLVERIREVRALLGFTRIQSNGDFAEATQDEAIRMTPIKRDAPTWLPASEVRGEGLFLRIKEEVLQAWLVRPAVQRLREQFLASHKAWRQFRGLQPVEDQFPGMRLVLLHSLAHALMRTMALECGYTQSSVRERLYSREAGAEGGPMAGILLYTAAPDSEGTLGGLVQLGQPGVLGRQLQQALESMRLCGSDPLCADHTPERNGRGIHGAACHACQFAPETSCERGNRYLDRSVLVETFAARGAAFFDAGV